MLEAVRREGRALSFASGELSDDRELVLEARGRRGRWRRGRGRGAPGERRGRASGTPRAGSSGRVRGERPAPEAVRQNGAALTHASERLRGDREVVLEALDGKGQPRSPDAQACGSTAVLPEIGAKFTRLGQRTPSARN